MDAERHQKEIQAMPWDHIKRGKRGRKKKMVGDINNRNKMQSAAHRRKVLAVSTEINMLDAGWTSFSLTSELQAHRDRKTRGKDMDSKKRGGRAALDGARRVGQK
jgi:hypothetical protein